MKHLYILFSLFLFLFSCKPSGDFLSRRNQERAFIDAIKALDKNPDDANAKQAIIVLYPKLQQQHLGNIELYSKSNDISRWDNLANEYGSLQKMYDAVTGSSLASNLVRAENYQSAIIQIRQNAAEDYYQQGIRLYNTGNKNEAKYAYSLFKKSDAWIAGYKDVSQLIRIAWQNSILNIVINPIKDNSWMMGNKWGSFNNFSYNNFTQTLTNELGGEYAVRYSARFYTDWDARRMNIVPDWSVNISFQSFDMPRPQDKKRFRAVSKQVEDGRDSTGQKKYRTITANITIYEQTFTVRGKMDIEITDFNARRNISMDSYNEDFFTKTEYATYTGDKRALDDNDWKLINRRGNQNFMSREEINNELYRMLYPRIKNRIESAVRWN
jgi:hypothetical protein